MKIKIWTAPGGADYHSLPRTWNGTTNITERWALAHGWSFRENEVPDPPAPPARYSKLYLRRALAAAGLWDDVWSALDAGQRAYWQEANDLADDDPDFAAALGSLRDAVAAGAIALPEGVTVDALLDAARAELD